jgi:hypothetical protein
MSDDVHHGVSVERDAMLTLIFKISTALSSVNTLSCDPNVVFCGFDYSLTATQHSSEISDQALML